MAEEKKVSFYQKVMSGLTGKTPEQRQADAVWEAEQRRANQIALQTAKAKELASYRQERVAKATEIGRAKADFEAKQQIANVGKPKPMFSGINLGTFGKAQEGFDINNVFGTGGATGFGGGTPAHQGVKRKIKEMHRTAPQMFSVNDAINFSGGSSGWGRTSRGGVGLSKVRRKIRKHRIKHHRKNKGSGKRQSFTITMNK